MKLSYLYLFFAIISEVFATSLVKLSNGFTKIFPSILVLIGYISSSFFLSLALQNIPVAIAYALWSGLGILFVTLSGYFLYNQKLNFIEIIGILLIISGIFVMNIFSAFCKKTS
ncbi:multidrug resistance protein [Wigglesworthia glossinidia endosymbiont of Glossina morsitans morsitans (Yale colony)]|uniref:Multidrug resistance protein n=1 Tax=Wigglesworthia glossinidia endosymbiont of Glossina morsitans morsitans (Yale colony) TaxID=1142511 RepID=H6Q4E9_WIGGL|nr:multidrug efflux SMR transporter [Wigglesworthia glossinidia]AFA41009.1 multidrug resistance protein [Wigglesworthia glossinidia endosymbiont of Glossina morsitans morsitans (Yale colony)]